MHIDHADTLPLLDEDAPHNPDAEEAAYLRYLTRKREQLIDLEQAVQAIDDGVDEAAYVANYVVEMMDPATCYRDARDLIQEMGYTDAITELRQKIRNVEDSFPLEEPHNTVIVKEVA